MTAKSGLQGKTAIQELLDWYATKGADDPEGPDGLYVRASYEYAILCAAVDDRAAEGILSEYMDAKATIDRQARELSLLTLRAQEAERITQALGNSNHRRHDLLSRIRLAIGKVDFRTATGELKTWTCELPSELINELDEEVY